MSLSIRGCRFDGNHAGWEGGALSCSADQADILESVFVNNSVYSYGGAISIWNVNPANIYRCAFSENTAYCGGVLYVRSPLTNIMDCSMDNNSGDSCGGCIRFFTSGSMNLLNCVFSQNIAPYGACIYSEESYDSMLFTNCTFAGNTASVEGGAICVSVGTPTPIPVTWTPSFETPTPYSMKSSQADQPGNIPVEQKTWGTGRDNIHILQCILWNNSPDQLYIIPSTAVTVNYTNIQNGYSGSGNMDEDPLFAAGAQGGFYLSQIAAGQTSDSPCIDAGLDLAEDVCFTGIAPNTCLDDLTTRTDAVSDSGIVDLGFHYPGIPTATGTPNPDVPGDRSCGRDPADLPGIHDHCDENQQKVALAALKF